jgi:SAM-dependent methyltransferase
LHEWHVDLIQSRFLPHIPHGGLVLDVASGYGRISLPVQTVRQDIQLLGLDFAYPYCQYYAANLCTPAVCASINDLPFETDFAHGIIAVTALMYVTATREREVLEQLVRRLKPGGYALFMDPGLEFLHLASLFKRSETSTSGKGFKKNAYLQLGRTDMTRVVAAGGCPVFSYLLPVLYVTAKNRGVAQKFLRVIRMLDNRAGSYHKFTLHRWMLLQRIDESFNN